MHVKWSDYLSTAIVRGLSGAVIGLVSGVVVAFFGNSIRRHHLTRSHSPLVDLIQQGKYGPLLVWLAVAATVGATVAVVTIPRWQTPWYKSILEDSQDKDDRAA
jgi:hypothetical protein